jgi:transcriptional regulator GlxA family with amidase domain
MRFFNLLNTALVLCFFVVAAGCENKRYQPAQWSNTTLPENAVEASKTTSGGAKKAPEKPTDWMTMVGKGGENVKRRSTSLPTAANRGGTLPARGMGTSLPARAMGGTSLPSRGVGGTTLPAGQSRSLYGTTMPQREGTTLPRR